MTNGFRHKRGIIITRIVGLTLLLFLLVTPCFSSHFYHSVRSIISTPTKANGDYVIFRADIPPMFIKNASSPVKVLAIPFEDNKPVYASVTIHIIVSGLNIHYTLNKSVSIYTGRGKIIYLNPMQEGHYNIKLWATWDGVQSITVNQDFAVSPAPEPYELYFDQDGSHIHFKSKVLNSTGQIDPNVTFHIEIWLWDGSQESLVQTYNNVTNLTITVPPSWKSGILIVDVVDRFGWRNGMTINLANFQFDGVPVQYDYHYAQREPFASRHLWYAGAALFTILVIAFYIRRWYNE